MKLDKHMDPLCTMEKANQRGKRCVQLFTIAFTIGFPMGHFMQCIGNLIYNRLKYGYVNVAELFHMLKFMYKKKM